MKKLILIFFAIFFISACAGAKNTFRPDLSKITSYKKAERVIEGGQQPYIAIFKKDGKTLIYLATNHDDLKSMDMIDYVFANFRPQVSVIEYERAGRKLKNRCSDNEFEYLAGISVQKNIPVVLADLSRAEEIKIVAAENPDIYKIAQAQWMINNSLAGMNYSGHKHEIAEKGVNNFKHFAWTPDMPQPMAADEFKAWFKENFGKDYDTADLNEIFKTGWAWPDPEGTVFNKFDDERNVRGREPFMLKNIAAALNKYKVVFAAFGEGHYTVHREILEDMLGKPEYIMDIQYNAERDNCPPGFKFEHEVLVP